MQEKRLTLVEAAKLVPNRHGGNGIAASTVWRWAVKDVRGGVRLETTLCGGIRYTTAEALERFFKATTAAADAENGSRPRRPASYSKRCDDAERRLSAVAEQAQSRLRRLLKSYRGSDNRP